MQRFLIWSCFFIHFAAPARTFYVAPRGNDQAAGTLDKPFASVSGALAAVRRWRRSNPTPEAITVQIRGGRYELVQPIVLRPEDSGSDKQRPFTIEAYPGETPMLSGGRRISGFREIRGKPGLWRTELPSVFSGSWYFHQLFVNGQRRQRARTPNEGFFQIQGPSPNASPAQFTFRGNDIKSSWAKDGDVEAAALIAWWGFRMQIRAVDDSRRMVTLGGKLDASGAENDARYYIENAADALDQPGEWYLSRKTGSLWYWAMPGENPNALEITASQLPGLIELRGDVASRSPIRHVVLRGLTFCESDWLLDGGRTDFQAAVHTAGDLFAQGSLDCTIEDCTFRQLGGYAIELGVGCQRFEVRGNEISDAGAGGIKIGSPVVSTEPFDQNHSHSITDNHIHHLGEVSPEGVGILILQSGTNRVAHNHIHHLYYTAISVGWTWGYRDSPCRQNRIEFNHLHDVGQGRLSDMGAVYTLGIQEGTVVRNNLIHDVESYGYGGWGLYTDEGSTGIVMENNVVYRCKSAGFHQHYGKDNIIRNNIFAFGKENQLMRTRDEPHRSFVFTNNIVYYDSGALLAGNWSSNGFQLDRNLYFDTRLKGNGAAMKFGAASLNEWKMRGHDLHSLIADPLFVNPEKGDFRFQRQSPALEFGIKPFDLQTAGIRPRSLRD